MAVPVPDPANRAAEEDQIGLKIKSAPARCDGPARCRLQANAAKLLLIPACTFERSSSGKLGLPTLPRPRFRSGDVAIVNAALG